MREMRSGTGVEWAVEGGLRLHPPPRWEVLQKNISFDCVRRPLFSALCTHAPTHPSLTVRVQVIQVQPGRPVAVRLINAASLSFFNVALHRGDAAWTVAQARDGSCGAPPPPGGSKTRS